MKNIRLDAFVASSLLLACSQPTTRATSINGQSETLAVRGEYAPVALTQVDGLALDNGKLVIRGGSERVTIDPPASADPARPNQRWTLVSESMTDRKRVVTFTHETSLDEFTIELPESDAELHYGALSSRAGGDVLVFAWGAESRSYWGFVTITNLKGPAS